MYDDSLFQRHFF